MDSFRASVTSLEGVVVLEQYKKEFIEFMVECNVLTFGDFVTKSGRKTPFFVNAGNYKTGKQLKKLGVTKQY